MVGRPKLWPDKMVSPLPEGSFKRMDAVRGEEESRTDYMRAAFERETAWREGRTTTLTKTSKPLSRGPRQSKG